MPSWNDNTANLPDRENAIRAELAGSAGLPAGGSAGQVLAKNSSTDGDASWKAVSSGSSITGYASRAITATTNPTQYSATTTDNVLLCDATSGRVEITLPAASGNSGKTFTIRKTDSSSHNVFVCPAGTETLDGAPALVSQGRNVFVAIASQWGQVALISDGTNWHRLFAPYYANSFILYVDATLGNDSNTGLMPWAPKKTIGAAVTAAFSGSIIYIARGTYVETVDPGSGIKQNMTLQAPIPGSVTIQAPTTSASALQFSSNGPFYIKGLAFQGNTGSASTYTGTVCNMSNFTIGSVMEDCSVTGINTDFTGSKTAIGAGTNGGIGMSFDGAEQATYRNISVDNCNIGLYFPGTGTLSKLRLIDFHLNQCFIVHQEVSSGSWGDNTFQNLKTQNVFGLTYAVAQLSSNGSNPADGDTVLVRNVTYRFKNTMAQANDVKIGANIDATLLSLVKAVNGTGVAGTDYFTGTAQPTGVQAGWMNLVDYGASGGNGFTLGAVDTTHHACTFQVTDVLGPSGNAYTFTVTSTNLSDYFAKGTFARAAWAIEAYHTNNWIDVDAMENIALPAGNAILLGCSAGYFDDFVTAPQTQLSITGSTNIFVAPKFQNAVTVQSGATNNIFDWPFNNTGTTQTNSSRITDNGTGTVIRLGARAARNPLSVTYGANMTPRTDEAEDFVITATNGTAFTIANPSPGGSSNLVNGMTITVMIRNTSGGALGTATWGANYKMSTWTQPANGFSRSITFRYDGTNWIEISRTPSDVPN